MTKPKEKPQKVVTIIELVVQTNGEIWDNTSFLNEFRNYMVDNIGWKHVNVRQDIVDEEDDE